MKHPTRTLKELYTILLVSYIDNVQNKVTETQIISGDRRYSFYICNHISELANYNIITAHEKIILLGDFQSQRPTKTLHTEFYNNPKFYKRLQYYAWWKYKGFSIDGIKEKVKFLTHLVTINSND